MVWAARRKLSAFRSSRNKLEASDDKTREVSKLVVDIADSFDEYIRNDNVDSLGAFSQNLSVKVEEHPDFETAVRHLDSEIRKAEEELRRKEEEERRKKKALLGGI